MRLNGPLGRNGTAPVQNKVLLQFSLGTLLLSDLPQSGTLFKYPPAPCRVLIQYMYTCCIMCTTTVHGVYVWHHVYYYSICVYVLHVFVFPSGESSDV